MMVIFVPPLWGPLAGEIEDMDGAAFVAAAARILMHIKAAAKLT
jgi:hypothetical protein